MFSEEFRDVLQRTCARGGLLGSTMLAKRLKRCSILLFVFLLADASGSFLESSSTQAEAIGPQISPATEAGDGAGGEGEGKRRSLATGMFCVALQNADPTALQEGLNWACGQGRANCAAIQPGGPCYKANNLPALASYAYNDYYQRNSGTGATCSFNGTATTTATDPSSGQCVFSGSSMAGGTTPAANAPSAVGPFTPGFGNGSSSTFPGSPGSALTPFDGADSVMSGARRALCVLLLASPLFLFLLDQQ